MTAKYWLVTCSCGWGRECSSELGGAVSQHALPKLAPLDVAHVSRVEGPGDAGERQLTLT
jgi:hypothetical protein